MNNEKEVEIPPEYAAAPVQPTAPPLDPYSNPPPPGFVLVPDPQFYQPPPGFVLVPESSLQQQQQQQQPRVEMHEEEKHEHSEVDKKKNRKENHKMWEHCCDCCFSEDGTKCCGCTREQAQTCQAVCCCLAATASILWCLLSVARF